MVAADELGQGRILQELFSKVTQFSNGTALGGSCVVGTAEAVCAIELVEFLLKP